MPASGAKRVCREPVDPTGLGSLIDARRQRILF